MSDSWLVVIPQDPLLVPEPSAEARLVDALRALCPNADEVTSATDSDVVVRHAGENSFDLICPACGAMCDGWFFDAIDEWYARSDRTDFLVRAGCCGRTAPLHGVDGEYGFGFSRFAVEAMNPNIARLSEDQVRRLEDAFGHPLRLIYRHL